MSGASPETTTCSSAESCSMQIDRRRRIERDRSGLLPRAKAASFPERGRFRAELPEIGRRRRIGQSGTLP